MVDSEDARALLNRRLAAGEISPNDYDDLLRRIIGTEEAKPIHHRSRTGKIIFIVVCIIIYYIIGIAVVGGGNSHSGEESIDLVAGLTGSLLVGLLIAGLISRKWPRTTFVVLPIALAAVLFGPTAEHQRQQSIADGVQQVSHNAKFFDVAVSHVQRSTASLLGKYPSVKDPVLDAPLSTSMTPDIVAKHRDAFLRAANDINNIKANYLASIKEALAADADKFKQDLRGLGATEESLDRIVALTEEGITSPAAIDESNKSYESLRTKFLATSEVLGVIIKYYKDISFDANGNILFARDENLQEYNKAARIEENDVNDLQQNQKNAEDKKAAMIVHMQKAQ
jgi:hypothetical protein